MIYRPDSGDSEHDRMGQQWVVIYGHVILSSSMKKGWHCKEVLIRHEKGSALRLSPNMKNGRH